MANLPPLVRTLALTVGEVRFGLPLFIQHRIGTCHSEQRDRGALRAPPSWHLLQLCDFPERHSDAELRAQS